MSKFFQRIKKTPFKILIQFVFQEFKINIPNSAKCPVKIIVQKGSKLWSTVKNPILFDKKVNFEEKIISNLTLYYDKKLQKFEKKEIFIRILLLLEEDEKFAGKIALDLSNFADPNSNTYNKFQQKLINSPDPESELSFSININNITNLDPISESKIKSPIHFEKKAIYEENKIDNKINEIKNDKNEQKEKNDKKLRRKSNHAESEILRKKTKNIEEKNNNLSKSFNQKDSENSDIIKINDENSNFFDDKDKKDEINSENKNLHQNYEIDISKENDRSPSFGSKFVTPHKSDLEETRVMKIKDENLEKNLEISNLLANQIEKYENLLTKYNEDKLKYEEMQKENISLKLIISEKNESLRQLSTNLDQDNNNIFDELKIAHEKLINLEKTLYEQELIIKNQTNLKEKITNKLKQLKSKPNIKNINKNNSPIIQTQTSLEINLINKLQTDGLTKLMTMIYKKTEETVSILNQKLILANEKTDQLSYYLNQNIEKITQLEEANEYLMTEIEELKNQLKKPENLELKNENDIINNDNIEIENLKKSNFQLETQNSELKKKFNKINEENLIFKKENTELKTKIIQLEQQFNNLKDLQISNNLQLNNENENFSSSIVKLTSDKQDLINKINELTDKIDTQTDIIINLRNKNESLENEIFRYKTKISEALNQAFESGGSELVEFLENAFLENQQKN